MSKPFQTVTRLISGACARYPGGLRAVFQAIQEKGGRKRSESAFYADFNPNESSQGNLKVADFMAAMEVTGEHDALRYLAAHFGYTLASNEPPEADAPTPEAEMLQDYPALVRYHESCAAYLGGKITKLELDALKDAVITEIRQTFFRVTE